jgi:hypothetical protein
MTQGGAKQNGKSRTIEREDTMSRKSDRMARPILIAAAGAFILAGATAANAKPKSSTHKRFPRKSRR